MLVAVAPRGQHRADLVAPIPHHAAGIVARPSPLACLQQSLMHRLDQKNQNYACFCSRFPL
jgi:hypothetical protein